ncbi:MAG: DUF4920 domain-containing protein [Nonlabens sp.]
MKYLLYSALAILALSACKEPKQEEEVPAVNDDQLEEVAYMDYGSQMSDSEAITAMELGEKYNSMKTGDTTTVKVKGVIADVCPKKGCWVKVPVGQDTTFVRFKDYSFFLPKNGKGKEVILEGKAFKSVTPVDELKHYAMDAGKSQEEIDAITKEEVTLKFTADAAKVEAFENPDVETAPETTEEAE